MYSTNSNVHYVTSMLISHNVRMLTPSITYTFFVDKLLEAQGEEL